MTTQPRFTFHLPFPAFALAMFGVLTVLAPSPGFAQTFTVLHAFTGGADGGNPFAGVTVGGPGVLYGTTVNGGTTERGVVFKLEKGGLGWKVSPLFEFPDGCDGAEPWGPVVVGPNGALYGTTEFGGCGNGTGTVFELQPPAAACKTAICYWSETVLHAFNGTDGADPVDVLLAFDKAGNIYGTTQTGGAHDKCDGGLFSCGVVFELTPSGGSWTESVLHSFVYNDADGWYPLVGVILDSAGNLYGTTEFGGTSGGTYGGGTVFKLSPSGGTWTESILYSFGNGQYFGGPSTPGTLLMDQSGNIYGPTETGGFDGTVFELTPSDGSWGFSTLYSFAGICDTQNVARDAAGNFYGTCALGGPYGDGMVFKLTNSGGSWTLTDLHDFTGGSDGAYPFGGVVLDSDGNLYGTTEFGGNDLLNCPQGGPGCGVVWEITP
jgi:uncharacterized repeat protein (TIGR03803 family)